MDFGSWSLRKISVSIFIFLLIFGCEKSYNSHVAISQHDQFIFGVYGATTAEISENALKSFQITQFEKAIFPNYKNLDAQLEIKTLLPKDHAVTNWRHFGSVFTYNRDNLYHDIIKGGNADLFLKFGMIEQINVEFGNDRLGSRPFILIEIFDMGNVGNAYGILNQFRHENDQFRTTRDTKIILTDDLFFFARSRYFVRIEAYEFATAINSAAINFASQIIESIPLPSKRSSLFTLLPKENRVPKSMVSFPNAFSFAKGDGIFPRSIFDRELAESVIGNYVTDQNSRDHNWTQFVIFYRTPEIAKEIFSDYKNFIRKSDLPITVISEGTLELLFYRDKEE